MNTQLFSDAMGELGEKYIVEAATYNAAEKNQKKVIFIGNFRIPKQVVAVIVIVVLFFTTACGVKAFREAITEFFIGMGDGFYDFYLEYDSPDTIEQRYCFATYPEGFEEISNEVSETSAILELQNADGDTIVLSQVCGTGSLAVDAEKGETEIVDVNGMEVLLYVWGRNNFAMWINDSYYFTLAYYGDTDVESMKELIEMIEIKEN